MPETSSRIRKANKASADQISESISSSNVGIDSAFDYVVATSGDLNEDDRKQVWAILEKNMHELLLNSSFGWDPLPKQREVFNRMSRFILVRPSENLPESLSLVGYTMFRFEREEDEDVVYCYELQVSEAAQQRGIGKMLVQMLVDVGTKWGMAKIMLTVLKSNVRARRFYQSAGFIVDPTSPEYQSGDEDECVDEDGEVEVYDYEILSKSTSPARP